MKLIIYTLVLISLSTFASEGPKAWKKCKIDSDCKIAPNLSCSELCYNKNFEKKAFEWEKNIVWDCMAPTKIVKIPRCIQGLCSCEEKLK